MKNTNWKKNVKESYNKPTRHKPVDNSGPIITGTKVEVRNDDVNGALRRLKKILERDNRQKDLARKEFYEKPSKQRKRARDTAKSRWKREVEQSRKNGNWVDTMSAYDTSWMKTKRKRRKHVELIKKIQSRGKK